MLNDAARLTGGAAAEQSFNDEALSLGNLFDLSSRDLVHFAFGTTVSVVEATLMAAFYLLFIFLEVQKLRWRVVKALAPASAEPGADDRPDHRRRKSAATWRSRPGSAWAWRP